jgi:hypothetical protein
VHWPFTPLQITREQQSFGHLKGNGVGAGVGGGVGAEVGATVGQQLVVFCNCAGGWAHVHLPLVKLQMPLPQQLSGHGTMVLLQLHAIAKPYWSKKPAFGMNPVPTCETRKQEKRKHKARRIKQTQINRRENSNIYIYTNREKQQ